MYVWASNWKDTPLMPSLPHAYLWSIYTIVNCDFRVVLKAISCSLCTLYIVLNYDRRVFYKINHWWVCLLFGHFQTNIRYNFYNKLMWKKFTHNMVFRFEPQPSEYESHPITTRPVALPCMSSYPKQSLSVTFVWKLGGSPGSSGYGMRLMFRRSWVWIPIPCTGWIFSILLL